MQVNIFGNSQDLFERAFYSTSAMEVNVTTISATSTRVVVRNPETGFQTTFNGTGLSDPNVTLTGTVTSMEIKNNGGQLIASFSDMSWSTAAFVSAMVADLEDGNSGPLNALLSLQPVDFDASGSTSPVDLSLDGVTSNLSLLGSNFNDVLAGGLNSDTIEGGAGSDLINPGDNTSDDVIIGGGGNDTISFSDLEDGYVFMDYSGVAAGLTVQINGAANTGSIQKGGLGTDTLVDVRNPMDSGWFDGGLEINGSAQNDTFTIHTDAEQWISVRGGQGKDTFAFSGNGNMQIDFRDGTQGINVNLSTGTIANDGFGNAETVSGEVFQIIGTDFTDVLIGSNANESFAGRRGNDTIDGGGGFDRLRYDRNEITQLTVDLAAGTAQGKWNGANFVHTISNFERVRGSQNDDIILGDEFGNRLEGRNGNDNLNGRAGDDTLYGENGNDTLKGGGGNDTLNGGNGNDLLNPGDNTNYDWIEASSGNDTIDMSDIVTGYVDLFYGTIGGPVTYNVNGASNTGTVSKGVDGTDTMVNVAKAMEADGIGFWGSDANDTFNIVTGDDQFAIIRGGAGADSYSVSGSGSIRLDLRGGGNGVNVNLGTSEILDDGYGNFETVSGTIREIRATDFSDVLIGSNARESFILQGGNDTVDGGGGFDRIRYDRDGYGGVTVDLAAGTVTGWWNGVAFLHDVANIEEVRGSEFADMITGAASDDYLFGANGSDTLNGGAGDDTLEGGSGYDQLHGGAGFDRARFDVASTDAKIVVLFDGFAVFNNGVYDYLTGIERLEFTDTDIDTSTLGVFTATVPGNNGNNILDGTGGNDVIDGMGGNDFLDGGLGNDTILGGQGNDSLLGRDGDDSIDGGNNHDNIALHGGNDTATGGLGNDSMGGGDGNDILFGERGNDIIGGGNGDDVIDAGDDKDAASGGYGSDLVYGGDGDDTLAGSFGNDTVSGGEGNDALGGGRGHDLIFGRNGNDNIGAGEENDTVYGGNGNDFIGGAEGEDLLFGESGNDTLNGGTGNDTMDGGDGADLFVFNALTGGEVDVIQGFEDGIDKIRLHGAGPGALSITNIDAGAQVVISGGHTIIVEDMTAGTLTTADFIFV